MATESEKKQETTSHDEEEDLGAAMSFLEHLTELRTRLIRSLIALSIAVTVCLMFASPLVELLLKPIPQDYLKKAVSQETQGKVDLDSQNPQTKKPIINLIATHPIEAIITQMKVAFVAGLFIAFPIIFYEAWMFIAPGLYRKERKVVLPMVISAWLCFIAGGLFSYFVVYGFTLLFLTKMTPEGITNMWKISEYMSFTLQFMLAFGIVFEEPVVIILLARIGLITHEMLIAFRRYAIVGSLILAAIVAPPDPTSMVMCAIPLIVLYEISLHIVRFIEKKREAVE